MNLVNRVINTKWLVPGFMILGIILLVTNLIFGGSNPTEVSTPPATEQVVEGNVETNAPPATAQENTPSWQESLLDGNFFMATTFILLIVVTTIAVSRLKRPLPANAAAGTNPSPLIHTSILWFIAGVLMVLVALWGIVPALLDFDISEDVLNEINWFMWVSIIVFGGVLIFGARQYTKIAGNTAAYVLMGVITIICIIGVPYLIGLLFIEEQTEAIVGAIKNDLGSAAGSLVEVNEETSSINWGALFDSEIWLNIALLATLVLSPVVVFHQYVSKNKLAVYPVLIVALMILLGGIYYLLKNYEPAREIMNDLGGVANEAYEALPMVGEDHYVDLARANFEPVVVQDIGPNDSITIYLDNGICGVNWMPTDNWLARFGNEPWYDPNGYYLNKIRGGNGVQRTYTFTESFKDGLDTAGAKLQLVMAQVPC